MTDFIRRNAYLYGTALLIALLSVCQSSAATNPLNGPRGLALASNGNLYLANRSNGNLYVRDANNQVVFNNLGASLSSVFVSLSFSPEGIAVDSTRGRVYISNEMGNAIAVYSTSGTLLNTIQ